MANSTKKAKNYLKGSAKLHQFSNGGHVIHVDLLKSDLDKLPVNKSGYIKITIGSLTKADQYGNTHTVYENEFEPKTQTGGGAKPMITQSKPQAPSQYNRKPSTNDLPF